MKTLICIIIIAIALVTIIHFWLPISLAIGKFFHAIYYAVVDTIFYFYHREYNNAHTGFIDMYTGLFGRGKTLSAVHYVVNYYNRYNNKIVYDKATKSFVRQYVNILSNVHLSVPYTDFISMEQIVDIAEQQQEFEREKGCHLVNLCLIDECSVQLNSRSFKTNFSTPMLNALLTCRHVRMAFVLTSQRYFHCDKLLRDVTTNVIECRKLWRLQCQYTYDAWDMENAGSATMLKPIKSGGFFVMNKDYSAYDTSAIVKNFIKDYKSGEILTDGQILALQGLVEKDLMNANHVNRRKLKRMNKTA